MSKRFLGCVLSVCFFGVLLLVVSSIELCNEIKLKNDVINNLSIRLNTFEPQLKLNIDNIGKHLHDIAITDSIGNKQMLSNYMTKYNKALICRYSSKYCQECVSYAINTLCNISQNADFNAIVFINDNDSQRVSKIELSEYGINSYYYGSCKDLAIPAENVMFPYYLLIDNELRINGVYFPNKEARNFGIDSANINMILKTLLK